MTASRPVRIPRARVPRRTGAPVPPPSLPCATVVGLVERRPYVAGSHRALRLTLFYLVAVALLYVLFLGSAEVASRAGGAGPNFDLLLFGVAALVFALAGVLIALHPAPRRIEITPTAITVVGRWGHRTTWTPRAQLTFRRVRRFAAGILSSDPVESLELSLPGRPPRTYLVTEGLFATDPDAP